jgi:membrane protease YdiL (CAAX protease family)
MARCGACNAEFEGMQQTECPACGVPRPRPRVARPAAPEARPEQTATGGSTASQRPSPHSQPAARGPQLDGASLFVTVSQPAPAAAPGIQRQGHQGHQAACSVCGRWPATSITLRRAQAFILWIRQKKLDAVFCRAHGEAAAREYMRGTLVEGWWTLFIPIGVIFNLYAIGTNMSAIRKLRALDAPIGMPGQEWDALPSELATTFLEPPEVKRDRRSVLATVGVAIGLGVAIFVLAQFVLRTSSPVADQLRISTALTSALYILVAIAVLVRVTRGIIRPQVGEGSRVASALLGLGSGAAAGGLIIAVNSAIAGRLSSDPNMIFTISEQQVPQIVTLVLLVTVAAPLVEEFLFRGLLVESMRSRGRISAVFAGAVAFSFWHLNPAALRYYVVAGLFLGLLYWHRGIVASIAAHFAFNGTLVVAAFVAVASPAAHTVTSPVGVTVQLDDGWHEEASIPVGPMSLDVGAEAAGGYGFVIAHIDHPGLPDAERSQQAAIDTYLRANTDVTGPEMIEVAEGRATRYTSEDPSGFLVRTITTTRGQRTYLISLVSLRSTEAERQFGEMLKTLVLPPL